MLAKNIRGLSSKPNSPESLSLLVRTAPIENIRVWPREPSIEEIIEAGHRAFGVNFDDIKRGKAGNWEFPITRCCVLLVRYTTSVSLGAMEEVFNYKFHALPKVASRALEDLTKNDYRILDIFERICAEVDRDFEFQNGPTTETLRNKYCQKERARINRMRASAS